MNQPGVKPFDFIARRQPAKNVIISTKRLFQMLEKVFGSFQVSAKGIKITQQQDGRLHLEIDAASAACSHSFKIVATADGFTISPGQVAASGTPRTPTLAGRPLTDTQSALGPPLLVPGQGTAFVWIKAQLSPVLGALNVGSVALSYLQTTTWNGSTAPLIEWGANLPADIPAEINFETGATSPGTFYTQLGRVSRTGNTFTVLEQNWISNIALSLTGQGTANKLIY